MELPCRRSVLAGVDGARDRYRRELAERGFLSGKICGEVEQKSVCCVIAAGSRGRAEKSAGKKEKKNQLPAWFGLLRRSAVNGEDVEQVLLRVPGV